MMKEKSEGIERARAEEEAKLRSKDDMIKQVLRANSLGVETSRVKPETKSVAKAKTKANS